MTIPSNPFKTSAASPVTSAPQTANQATNAAKSAEISTNSLASSVVANLKAAAAESKPSANSPAAKTATKTSPASTTKKAISDHDASDPKKNHRANAPAETNSALANKATYPLQDSNKAVNETINITFKSLQQQAEKANQIMIKNNQEFSKFFEDNLNSTLQAFNALAKSSEEISKAYFSFAQNTIENNIAAAKSLFSARNAQEVFDLQSKTAKSNIDSLINESTKLSQLSIDAANKAMQPIQNRINQTVESIIKKAA